MPFISHTPKPKASYNYFNLHLINFITPITLSCNSYFNLVMDWQKDFTEAMFKTFASYFEIENFKDFNSCHFINY